VLYDAADFLHIVSALGLAAAFGVEAAGLVGLRRATGADEALLWLRSRRWVLLIGPAMVWTAALADQHRGSRLSAVAVNPGMAWTPGTQALTPDAVPAWRYIWPIVRFFQRRADPDHAAASCTAHVIAPASAIDGRYFDGRKPHPLPRRVLDPDLRERVLQLGHDLAHRAAG